MYHKQYITIREASIYTQLSKVTVQEWLRQGLLSSGKVQGEVFIDPDELDLMLEFRQLKGHFHLKNRNIVTTYDRGWRDAWMELKDDLLKKITPIPTFTNSAGPDYSYAAYKRKTNNVEIRALLIRSEFRVISDNHPNVYAIKTSKKGGYLIQLIANKKVYLTYRKQGEFEQLFQYVSGAYVEFDPIVISEAKSSKQAIEELTEIIPVYKTVKTYQKQIIGITEEEMIDYIFSHSTFREQLIEKLVNVDMREREIIQEMLQDE